MHVMRWTELGTYKPSIVRSAKQGPIEVRECQNDQLLL